MDNNLFVLVFSHPLRNMAGFSEVWMVFNNVCLPCPVFETSILNFLLHLPVVGPLTMVTRCGRSNITCGTP